MYGVNPTGDDGGILNTQGVLDSGVWARPNERPNRLTEIINRYTLHPAPRSTGNTSWAFLPVSQGFIRLPELVVGNFPNRYSTGAPADNLAYPQVRRLIFPPVPPGQ